MKIDRILLVSSPLDTDDNRKDAVNASCFPPLGLLKIATFLSSRFPDIEVRVVDGDLIGLTSIEKIVASFQPQIVGVSVLTTSYKSALSIARCAKESGVQHVVFGNDHASFFPEIILRRHTDVSFIIAGDNGEQDLADLINAIRNNINPFETVSNLWAVFEGKVRSSSDNDRETTNLQTWNAGWADPAFLDDGLLARYQKSYTQRFGKHHQVKEVKAFTINNAKGCYKGNSRCFYCSIYDLKTQTGDTNYFWSLVHRYWQDYGFNFFFEVCDNFGGLKRYRRSLIETIPGWFSDSDVELMVYADADRICRDPEILEDFQRLHVRRVNIGFDSGDSGALKKLKGFRDADINKKAMSLLSERGIQIHCSFVLGGLGENENSIANTLSLISEALAEPNVIAMEVSPLFPLPKAPVWDVFLGEFAQTHLPFKYEELIQGLRRNCAHFEQVSKRIRAHFLGNDLIDLTLASQLWADYFTFFGYEPLQTLVSELNRKITDAGKVTGGFG